MKTGDQSIYARIRDRGLGITNIRMKVPLILQKRLATLKVTDELFASTAKTIPTSILITRVDSIAKGGDSDIKHKEYIKGRHYSKGLERVSEDAASRA